LGDLALAGGQSILATKILVDGTYEIAGTACCARAPVQVGQGEQPNLTLFAIYRGHFGGQFSSAKHG
jgi:hypothetical protein